MAKAAGIPLVTGVGEGMNEGKITGQFRSFGGRTQTMYEKTAENAKQIGWGGLPEFWYGNVATER